jgi:hypothetical protein
VDAQAWRKELALDKGEEFNSTAGVELDFVAWADQAFMGGGTLNGSPLLHAVTQIDSYDSD